MTKLKKEKQQKTSSYKNKLKKKPSSCKNICRSEVNKQIYLDFYVKIEN